MSDNGMAEKRKSSTSTTRRSKERVRLNQTSVISTVGWFVVAAIAGAAITGSLYVSGSSGSQLVRLGTLLSVAAGIAVGVFAQQAKAHERLHAMLVELRLPITLIDEPQILKLYQTIANTLSDLASHPDCLLRELAVHKINTFAEEIRTIANGRFEFVATETWRRIYERVLRSAGPASYYSVAWVRDSHYWQDQAGRQSMILNYDLVSQGHYIARTVILSEALWPRDASLPDASIRSWLDDQHDRGICLRLVREKDLDSEQDLLRDFGIYGGRAVGEQQLDHRCRTSRFTLYLDEDSVRTAFDRWERLNLFAVPYSEVMPSAIS